MLLNFYENQNMYDKQEIYITFINKILKKRVYGIKSALFGKLQIYVLCTQCSPLPKAEGPFFTPSFAVGKHLLIEVKRGP